MTHIELEFMKAHTSCYAVVESSCKMINIMPNFNLQQKGLQTIFSLKCIKNFILPQRINYSRKETKLQNELLACEKRLLTTQILLNNIYNNLTLEFDSTIV